MQTVFILQHSYETDGYEETKFIGVYSTEEEANQAINRLKDKPGFCNQPNAFHMDEYELNKDSWSTGFVTMITIYTKNNVNEWIAVSAECLPDNTYQIIELYNNDTLGPFKHLDIVECEERDNALYANKLVDKTA